MSYGRGLTPSLPPQIQVRNAGALREVNICLQGVPGARVAEAFGGRGCSCCLGEGRKLQWGLGLQLRE